MLLLLLPAEEEAHSQEGGWGELLLLLLLLFLLQQLLQWLLLLSYQPLSPRTRVLRLWTRRQLRLLPGLLPPLPPVESPHRHG